VPGPTVWVKALGPSGGVALRREIRCAPLRCSGTVDIPGPDGRAVAFEADVLLDRRVAYLAFHRVDAATSRVVRLHTGEGRPAVVPARWDGIGERVVGLRGMLPGERPPEPLHAPFLRRDGAFTAWARIVVARPG